MQLIIFRLIIPGKNLLMTTPLVSILILNWNGEDIIEQTVKSVLNSNYKNIEVLVVDNASKDNSIEILKKIPQIKIYQNSENQGYAKGNNTGFKYCNGKYIVTLNNDIIVDPDWLNEPVKVLESDQSIGIISCRQMNCFKQDIIDTLYSFPSSHLLLSRFGNGQVYQKENPLFSKPGYTIGANGASAIYRKSLIDELGGFEESFFAYHEECDLHMRAFFSGWKCKYIPVSVVYHKGSHSFNKVKKTFYYFHERNRIWFIYRNFPLMLIFKHLPWILTREIRTLINMVFLRGFLFTYLKARWDGFTGMSKFKAVRKANLKYLKGRSGLLSDFFKFKKLEDC